MITPPETCPYCGAAFKKQIGAEFRWECGRITNAHGEKRGAVCYERELAGLRKHLSDANRGAECNAKVNKELCRQLSASRAECAALRGCFEAFKPYVVFHGPSESEHLSEATNIEARQIDRDVDAACKLMESYIQDEQSGQGALEAVRAAQGVLLDQAARCSWCSGSGQDNDGEQFINQACPKCNPLWEAIAKLNTAFGAGEEGGSR